MSDFDDRSHFDEPAERSRLGVEPTVDAIHDLKNRLTRLGRLEFSSSFIAIPSLLMMLPELRGLWLAGGIDSSDNIYDASEVGTTLQPTSTPSTPVSLYQDKVPFLNFPNNQGWWAADAANLDFDNTDFMIGAWIWVDTVAGSVEYFMGKGDGVNLTTNYIFYRLSTGEARFRVCSGSTAYDVDFTSAFTTDSWNFVVCRFKVSTEQSIYFNGSWVKDVTGIPSGLNNSSFKFTLGCRDAGASSYANYMDGRMAFPFLSVSSDFSDAMVDRLYTVMKPAFRPGLA